MEAKILLSLNDVENIHECCFAKLFSITGIKGREFSVNKSGYVFEFMEDEKPHKRFIPTCYYAFYALNNILNNY